MNLATRFKEIINSELEKRGLKLVLDYYDMDEEYFEYYLDCEECEDTFFDAGEIKLTLNKFKNNIVSFPLANDDKYTVYKLRSGDTVEYRFAEKQSDNEDSFEHCVIINDGELYYYTSECNTEYKVIDFEFYPSTVAHDEVEDESTNHKTEKIDEKEIEKMRKKPRWAWTAKEYEIYSKLINQNKKNGGREQSASMRYKLSVDIDNKIKFYRYYNSYDEARMVLEKEINQKPQAAWKSDEEVIVYTIFNEPIRIKIEKVRKEC